MSASRIKIDLVTLDHQTGEHVIYLVESGPWDQLLDVRATVLKNRISGALEVVLLGLFSSRYPDSLGSPVRIQIDLHDEPPAVVQKDLQQFLNDTTRDEALQDRIRKSSFVSSLRVVTREQPGPAE